MENSPLCSICCVGYRHNEFLEDCVRSIWNNDYPNIEIVALDDGSNDGSVEKLERLARESPCPFRVIAQDNSGNVPANFNRVFRASKGEFVLFISLDDMLLPDSISGKMKILVQNSKIAFAVNTVYLKLMEDGQLKPIRPFPERIFNADVEGMLALERDFLHSFFIQNAIFRRDIVEKVGAFNENMLGDDIVLRTKVLLYMKRKPELVFSLIDASGFVYRMHAENLNKKGIRQIELVLQWYAKFWPNEQHSPLIKKWLLAAISANSFVDSLGIFARNPNSGQYLLDSEVKNLLWALAVRDWAEKNKTGTLKDPVS